MQILHCKIKERKKGKRKFTFGENSTLQNKRKGKRKCTSGANCTLQNKRRKGKRKCTSGANSTLQNKRKEKENVHLVQILHCKIKEKKKREKKMYIWCKFYIAK